MSFPPVDAPVFLYSADDVERMNESLDDIQGAAVKEHEAPKWPEMRRALEVVRKFVQKNRRPINGGTALNEMAKLADPGQALYDPEDGEPKDVDFYSPQPIRDMITIVDTLYAQGFRNLKSTEAVHPETYTIHVGDWRCCDCSYMQSRIYENVRRNSIEVAGYTVTPPHFMLIDYLRHINDPVLSFSRLDKAFPRMILLQQLYPLPPPVPLAGQTWRRPERSQNDGDRDYRRRVRFLEPLMRDFVVGHEGIVVIGGVAASYYRSFSSHLSAIATHERTSPQSSSRLPPANNNGRIVHMSASERIPASASASTRSAATVGALNDRPRATHKRASLVSSDARVKDAQYVDASLLKAVKDTFRSPDTADDGSSARRLRQKRPQKAKTLKSPGPDPDNKRKKNKGAAKGGGGEEQQQKQRSEGSSNEDQWPVLEFVSSDFKGDCRSILSILRDAVDADESVQYAEFRPFFDFIGRRGEFSVGGRCIVRVIDHNHRCVPYVVVGFKDVVSKTTEEEQNEDGMAWDNPPVRKDPIDPSTFAVQLGTFTVTVMFMLMLHYQIGVFGGDDTFASRSMDCISRMYATRNAFLKATGGTVFDDLNPFQEFVVKCTGKAVSPKIRKEEIGKWKQRNNMIKRASYKYEPGPLSTRDFDEVKYCNTSGNIINNPRDRWFKP